MYHLPSTATLYVGNSSWSDSRKEEPLELSARGQTWGHASAPARGRFPPFPVILTTVWSYSTTSLGTHLLPLSKWELFDSYVVTFPMIKAGVKNSACLCCSWQNFKWSLNLSSCLNQTRSYCLTGFFFFFPFLNPSSCHDSQLCMWSWHSFLWLTQIKVYIVCCFPQIF